MSNVFQDLSLFDQSELIFSSNGKNLFNCCQWNRKNVEPYVSANGSLVYKLDDEIKVLCYLKEVRQPQNVQQLELTGYQLLMEGYTIDPVRLPSKLLAFTAGVGTINGEHHHIQLLPFARHPLSRITEPIIGNPIRVKVIEKLLMRGKE